MRDRTKRYLEEFIFARRQESVKRKELLERFLKYKRENHVFNLDAQSISTVIFGIAANYLEKRACTYRYSHLCMECKREVYMCGMNCKTCGIWVCTQCFSVLDGICLCGECANVLKQKPKKQTGKIDKIDKICADKTQKKYVLMKRCAKNPTSADISELVQHAKEIEKEQHKTGDIQEKALANNLLSRMKQVLCEWHIFRAEEERCRVLIEQIKYLSMLKEETPEYKDQIDRSIEEILNEIAKKNRNLQINE